MLVFFVFVGILAGWFCVFAVPFAACSLPLGLMSSCLDISAST